MSNKYQIKSGFLKRTIAGETVLVPVGATTQEFNGMIMLNETGSFMWDLLKNPITKNQLVANMMKEFDAGEAEIRSDVDDFLNNGIHENLITKV